jgi:hypothetical protein
MKNRNLATHSLALLRACRQIYEETKSLWLGRILFDFNHVITLLDKLSSLPAFTLSRVRFIRVSADPLVLRVEGQNHHPFYRLVWVLKLLPHLRLDTLTVLGTYHGPLNYITLGTFVQHGSCWKELRFATRDSSMLGFSRAEPMGVSDPYRRKPQPLSWNQILLARDGTDSKASVTVYRANQEMEFGAVFTPENSREFNQEIIPLETPETFVAKENAELTGPNGRRRALLVVVKRGHQADISERDTGPYHPNDIGYWSDGMTWQEIKGMLTECYRKIR